MSWKSGNARAAKVACATFAITAAFGTQQQLNAQSTASQQVQARLGPTPTVIDTTTAAHLSGTFRAASERALPAVVYIDVIEGGRQIAQAAPSPNQPNPNRRRRGQIAPDTTNGRTQQAPDSVRQRMEDQLRQFFGGQFDLSSPDDEDPSAVREGTGSGFILDTQGYIMTNNHVVRNATRVTVRLLDGRVFIARVIGADSSTDVALIK